jgi:O-antigen/teichoic acid export membrane protein
MKRIVAALNIRASSRFSKDVFATFTTHAFVLLLGVCSSVLTARLLGPTGRGMLATFFAITAVGVQFGNFGLHAANTYFVSKDKNILSTLLSNSLFVSYAVMCPLIALVGFFFAIFPKTTPLQGWPLVFSLALIPFGLSAMLLRNLLLGIGNVRLFNWLNLSGKILGFAIAVFFFWTHNDSIVQLSGAYCLPVMGGVGLALFGFRQHLFKLPRFSTTLFVETLSYGFRAYVAAFFSFLVLRSDLLIIKYMLGAKDTGNYSIAVAMVDLLYIFPTVLGALLFPKLSAMGDEKAKLQLVKKTLAFVAVSMVLICVAAALLAKPATSLLFGSEFLPAVPAFLWLLPGIVMLSVSTIIMNFLASVGLPPIAVYSAAAAAILNVVANLILLPRLGIIGASIASDAAYGLMMGVGLTYLFVVRRESFG